NVTSPGGAEDVDYLTLKTPYRAPNQPMTSVDELRLIHGFDEKTVQTLLPYVTVLPPGVRTTINVNTAPSVVLAALAGQDLAWADRIAENRTSKPMNNVSELTQQLPAGTQLPSGVASVKTDFFLITLDTSIGRHQRRTLALMQRAGNATNWIWFKPEPLIDAVTAQGKDSTSGTDETAPLR